MAINYLTESEKYRPKRILTLLVGEAPPPNRKTYFYIPNAKPDKVNIEKDRSLPATIFNHYFGKRPENDVEYRLFLRELQREGIFLIDICDEPLKVRNSPEGLQRIIDDIPMLRGKMKRREISVPDEDIVFLLARENYKKHLRKEFPISHMIRWIDFRMSPGQEDLFKRTSLGL